MIIKPEARGHQCDVPWKDIGYGSTGYADGTIYICQTCRKAYVSRPCHQPLNPTSHWWRIHWWNWRLRRRVNAGIRGSPTNS